jgi:hypothetical protein
MKLWIRFLNLIVLVTLAFGFSQAAHAQSNKYNFTYTGDFGGIPTAATGTLYATANGDGSYTATSGTMTVTGFDAGSYSLLYNSLGTGINYYDGISYNNQLFLNQPQQLLDVNGLLFTNSGGLAYNLYYSTLGYQDYDSNSKTSSYAGSFTLTSAAVPELSSVLGFGSFVALGVLALVCQRRRTANA